LPTGTIRWTVGVAVVVVAGAIGARGVWDAVRSRPHFAIREVSVVGADRVSTREIRDLARVPAGTNTWDVDPAAVRRRVLRHPWIHTVRVQRALPDGLVVSVREHQAIAAAVSSETAYAVDRRGRIIARLPSATTDLPLIRGFSARDLSRRDPAVEGGLRQAATLVRILSRFHPVAEVEVDRVSGLTVRAFELPEVPIAFGWDDWKRKRLRLDTVLSLWAGRESQIRAVSVMFDGDVVLQLRDGITADTPAT
jgi:cell division protein FtsQ